MDELPNSFKNIFTKFHLILDEIETFKTEQTKLINLVDNINKTIKLFDSSQIQFILVPLASIIPFRIICSKGENNVTPFFVLISDW